MTTVEELYKNFGVLADAKDKAGEHEAEYLTMIAATKAGPGEKRLACQFIPRFFKHFPSLAAKAIDAQLDLCEDADVAIRRTAIKELHKFCDASKEHVPRIADVLTQLLQSEDAGELSAVQSALIGLFKVDAIGTLGGIYSQIQQGDDTVRENAIKFLSTKLKVLPEELFTPKVEEKIVDESKKVLEDVTGDEFVAFMKILSSLQMMSTVQGRKTLIDIISDQAELNNPLDATDPDSVDRILQCARQALPLFSKNVHSTAFAGYLCDAVADLDKVANVEEEDEKGEKKVVADNKLELLKVLTEMSLHCGELENLEARLGKVFNTLLSHMPLPPPADENGENKTPSGGGGDGTKEDEDVWYSGVECLMFTFHQLAQRCPGFLTDEGNADRLKDFRVRLQYLARNVQGMIKQLRTALQGKTGDALKEEQNKFRLVVLKISSNINTLIKDLFHNPPSYKATVTLSWKPAATAKSPMTSPGQKRSSITPITYEDGDKSKPKQPRKLYEPPSGKWSDKAGQYAGGPRGRGGFRGGFRGGRGRGRGFRPYRGGNRW